MEDLVTFGEPPVSETVISVGFEPIEGLTAAHIGQLQAEVFPDYGNLRELPPYSMPVERLAPGGVNLNLTFSSGLPPTRIAMVNDVGDRLFQVQRDWFASNWRRMTNDDEYPRYEANREVFLSGWTRFVDWLKDSLDDFSDPLVLQGEISYINHIAPTDVEGGRADYALVCPLLNDVELGSNLGPLESAANPTEITVSLTGGSPNVTKSSI